jgi:hypothetical protein
MRRTYVFRNGKWFEKEPSPKRKRGLGPMNGAGDGRGFSFQLPKYYKHANRFIESGPAKGRPCWTTKQEASEIAARARDAGEDIEWDAGGGLQED